MSNPKTIYLKDYTPPDFLIEQVELRIELAETATQVHARLHIKRNNPQQTSLSLNGQELELLQLAVNGQTLSAEDYQYKNDKLTIHQVPDEFILASSVQIYPQKNTSLEGLYRSSGVFCSQCEAEGFRKITFFLDRPDAMAQFRTTLVADAKRYPVLLSNGNPEDSGTLGDGRHFVTWVDPYKKPCYLFAVVAGELDYIQDHYTTRSGREVELRIYTTSQHINQCQHAMDSLQHAMRWDEEVYGCEYDLDIYNIVAVSDFNMGAMENKGLNIFNTQFVLAQPETATDQDYQGVESVIAHEYFHNWTGNRVTCRDWFQLSLKEGLTVFRDQEFSADRGSRGVQRIDDVRILRTVQFAQDASPMAHPVRPDSYIEINNFYTVTVYNKGAEVVRMIHTLLGAEGFRRGMDLYFQRYDGQAVTCEDFVAAMSDANDFDFAQFQNWYHQAGTPEIHAQGQYDEANASYHLTLRQSCPPTPGQTIKKTFHIPVKMGLLDQSGQSLPLQLAGENAPTDKNSRILELREKEQTFHFINIPQAPVPSLLQNFSAPVKLHFDYSDADLCFLLAHDNDAFNRWDASQQLAIRHILALRTAPDRPLADSISQAYQALLNDDQAADAALRAYILTLPSEAYLAEHMEVVDVEGLHWARQHMQKQLTTALEADFLKVYQHYQSDSDYMPDPDSIGRRSLKNRCLDYLMLIPDGTYQALALKQYQYANNMTDQLAALQVITWHGHPDRQQVLDDFYKQWQHQELVVDKWLSLQASDPSTGTLSQVKALMNHAAFNLSNPNKIRALIGAFCHNQIHFHAQDGSGYRFAADQVIALDAMNPQIAARLLGVFTRWRRYGNERQNLMQNQLQRVLACPNISPDVYEIVAKSVATE